MITVFRNYKGREVAVADFRDTGELVACMAAMARALNCKLFAPARNVVGADLPRGVTINGHGQLVAMP